MANLLELEYDGDKVFETASVTEAQMQAAKRLTDYELECLFLECVGAFETTHSNYQFLPKEVYDRAGSELIELFERLCSD